jgi:hypothetical protein
MLEGRISPSTLSGIRQYLVAQPVRRVPDGHPSARLIGPSGAATGGRAAPVGLANPVVMAQVRTGAET